MHPLKRRRRCLAIRALRLTLCAFASAAMASPTILIVEDNAITRRALRAALESADYKVREASDGSAALQSIRANPPDLILQDLILPDIYGIELLERIRQLPLGQAIPVIACSGLMTKI